jgi:hypothetical protein
LIEPEKISIPWKTIEQDGSELIRYFPNKYFRVLGVIDKKEKIILFHKRKPVIVTSDRKIHASDLDGNRIEIDISNVKYFYVKREMPYTEAQQNDP